MLSVLPHCLVIIAIVTLPLSGRLTEPGSGNRQALYPSAAQPTADQQDHIRTGYGWRQHPSDRPLLPVIAARDSRTTQDAPAGFVGGWPVVILDTDNPLRLLATTTELRSKASPISF